MWANGVQFMRNQYLAVYLVLYPVTSKGQKITPPPLKNIRVEDFTGNN